MRKLIVIALLLVMFGLGAAISYHNPQSVSLNYLAGSSEQGLGALLVLVAAATICLMVAVYWVLSLPRRAELARLRRRLNKAETELDNLRKLPLKDG